MISVADYAALIRVMIAICGLAKEMLDQSYCNKVIGSWNIWKHGRVY